MINAPTTLVVAIFAGIAVFAVVGWLLAMKTARKEIEHSKAVVELNRQLTREYFADVAPADYDARLRQLYAYQEDGLDV